MSAGHGLFETARGTVHTWQCDHMGHITVRAYGEFFEEACWPLYNIRYLRELLAGDVVVVRSGITEMRGKVLKFAHELRNEETGVLCATSAFTVLCIDSAARRAKAFPDDIAARATALVTTFDPK